MTGTFLNNKKKVNGRNRIQPQLNELEFQQELKDFLFGISIRLEYIYGQEQKEKIKEISAEYSMLYRKLKLLSLQYYDADKELVKEQYYIITRKYYPVLDSCLVIINYYENKNL